METYDGRPVIGVDLHRQRTVLSGGWPLRSALATLDQGGVTSDRCQEWRPVIERNLERLRGNVTGQPHRRNLDRWQSLVVHSDVLGLHRVLTGLDRDSIEMREVSPMGGLLPQDEPQGALREGQPDASSSSAPSGKRTRTSSPHS